MDDAYRRLRIDVHQLLTRRMQHAGVVDDSVQGLVEFVDELVELVTIANFEAVCDEMEVLPRRFAVAGGGVDGPSVLQVSVDQTEADAPAGTGDDRGVAGNPGPGSQGSKIHRTNPVLGSAGL